MSEQNSNSARCYETSQVHYLKSWFDVAGGDDQYSGASRCLGWIPARAAIVKACAVVSTLFDGTGTEMRFTFTPEGGTAASVDTADVVTVGLKNAPLTSQAGLTSDQAIRIDAALVGTGDRTVGQGYAIVEYIVDNDAEFA